MALLIFAFVKNGYLLRLASTLQQNWPHSFRKMSFDVWRIFLYFSSNKHISMFCQQWWDLLAHLLCLVGGGIAQVESLCVLVAASYLTTAWFPICVTL